MSTLDHHLRTLVEAASDALLVVDDQHVVRFSNERAATVLGRQKGCAVGERFGLDTPAGMSEIEIARPDGIGFAELHCSTIDWDGAPCTLVSIRDVTQRKLADMRAEAALEQFRLRSAALEASASAIMITSTDGRIEWMNPAFERLHGYAAEDVIGESASILRSGVHGEAFYRQLWDTVTAGETWRGLLTNRRRDGSTVRIEQTITPMRGADGTITHFVSVMDDLTERLAYEEKIQQMAETDPLTGLPNRLGLQQRVREALRRARRGRHGVAVAIVAIDRMKLLSDRYGPSFADKAAIAVSDRLRRHLAETDVLARLGDDEFAVMLDVIEGQTAAALFARRAIDTCSAPLALGGEQVLLSATLGIATWPADGNDTDALLRNAAIALRQARAEGQGRFRFFDHGIDVAMRRRLAIETALGGTTATGAGLRLLYQPLVALDDLHVIGAEALLRWSHGELGVVSPGEFVPIAEDSGQMTALGDWVLGTAIGQIAAWQRAGLPPLPIGVNISPSQFSERDLPRQIAELCRRHGVDPRLVNVEVTESLMMQGPEPIVAHLATLRSQGIGVSLDDFGTGYSSMARLRDLPVSRLKIDRSFVARLGEARGDMIIEAMIDLGHRLGLTVLAEGAERAEQVEALRRLSCDEMQGFYVSRAIEPERFAELVA